MALSKLTTTTLIIGGITLLYLLIVGFLNIYWYDGEVEPALDDVVGPHLKIVANAILLIMGTITGILFGIDFYKYRKMDYPDSSKDASSAASEMVDSSAVLEDIDKLTPSQKLDTVKEYNTHVIKCKNSIKQYWEKMQKDLKDREGADDLEEYPTSYATGKNNVWKVASLLEMSNKYLEDAEKSYWNLTYSRDPKANTDLTNICLSQRDIALEADRLWQESKKAAEEFSENIDYSVKYKRLAQHIRI